jgi:hypothetical protein
MKIRVQGNKNDKKKAEAFELFVSKLLLFFGVFSLLGIPLTDV